jgi:hypothetical protein
MCPTQPRRLRFCQSTRIENTGSAESIENSIIRFLASLHAVGRDLDEYGKHLYKSLAALELERYTDQK